MFEKIIVAVIVIAFLVAVLIFVGDDNPRFGG